MPEPKVAIVAYSKANFPDITQEQYERMTSEVTSHLTRALKLFNSSWWHTGDKIVYDESLKELDKAKQCYATLLAELKNVSIVKRLSERTVFATGLASIIGGNCLK